MQFQVPQFIETEDKIVGPFTLKQFGYVAAGAVLSAMLFFSVQTWLWIVGSIFIFALTLGSAFIKIEGRPLANVIISAINFYWKPQTYIWQPENLIASVSKGASLESENPSALEEMLMKSSTKRPHRLTYAAPTGKIVNSGLVTREAASKGSTLHKAWQNVQTGAPLDGKKSDRQFFEKRMIERYQIFRKNAGDRGAAKRVDYR